MAPEPALTAPVPERPDAAPSRAVGQRGAAHLSDREREVAEQDGRVDAVGRRAAAHPSLAVVRFEGAVDRRVAAPGVGGIDDVVVDEGAGEGQPLRLAAVVTATTATRLELDGSGA